MHNSLYVMYDLYSTEVLDVFDQNSIDLLQIVEDEDVMYTYSYDNMTDMKTFPSCNIHARATAQACFRSIYKAKNGGSVYLSVCSSDNQIRSGAAITKIMMNLPMLCVN
jgi:hypothetical protein